MGFDQKRMAGSRKSGRGTPKAPRSLDKSAGFYRRLGDPRDVDASLSEREELSCSLLESDLLCESADSEGKSPLIPRGWRQGSKRKSRQRVSDGLPAGEVHQEPTQGISEEVRGLLADPQPDQDVHFTVPREETYLLIEGLEGEKAGDSQKRKKQHKAKKYRKSIHQAFRRRWEFIVSNMQRLPLVNESQTNWQSPEPHLH